MTKHFKQAQKAQVAALFENENEYKKHMNNLRKTRDGLYNILENRPEFEDVVRPQFDTLNCLIGALLPSHPADYPYPPYHDVYEDIDVDIQATKKVLFAINHS